MKRSQGSISALVLCLVTTFVALTGLALDGGRVVNTYVRLSDTAANAARLGAQNVTGIMDNNIVIDDRQASREMSEYLRSRALIGTFSIDDRTVSVRLSQKIPMSVLSILGIRSRTVRVERTVSMVEG